MKHSAQWRLLKNVEQSGRATGELGNCLPPWPASGGEVSREWKIHLVRMFCVLQLWRNLGRAYCSVFQGTRNIVALCSRDTLIRFLDILLDTLRSRRMFEICFKAVWSGWFYFWIVSFCSLKISCYICLIISAVIIVVWVISFRALWFLCDKLCSRSLSFKICTLKLSILWSTSTCASTTI